MPIHNGFYSEILSMMQVKTLTSSYTRAAILANEKISRIHPPGPPCFWRAGQGAAAKIAAPFPAAAEKGSPEGQVPLALSA